MLAWLLPALIGIPSLKLAEAPDPLPALGKPAFTHLAQSPMGTVLVRINACQ